MLLMIDNYDSFTYNLVQYFQGLGETMVVLRNDEPLDRIDPSRCTGIVLSPGPSHPANAGITLEILREFAGVPMLGVCLGMQAMAHVFGGKVVRARRVMHGKVDRVRHRGGRLFADVPEEFEAVRYHSLVADPASLPECFETAAYGSDGEIMALTHRERFLWGVQFHPESHLTHYGMTIIRNFIGGANEHSKLHQRAS